MKLILTRHGETVENQQGVLAGHLPGSLSAEGIEQAGMLAGRLRHEKFDCIFSSDLSRAVDTTDEIIKYHPGVPVVIDKRLRETDYMGLTGQSKKLFDFTNWSPDVESRESMQERTRELLDEVYEKYHGKTVLFVGHAGINRALISVILDKPSEYMKEIQGVVNASIHIFEIGRDNNRVRLMNCTSHLG